MIKFKKLITIFVLLVLSFYSSAYNHKVLIANEKAASEKSEIALDEKIELIYDSLHAEDYDLDVASLKYALTGYFSLLDEEKITNDRYISIIDFNKPSSKTRFYTIDLDSMKVVFYTYVAHGKNSGMKKPLKFSDAPSSLQSSIGFYVTGQSYIGRKGYSLKLYGDEPGYNKNMYDRAIVIHTADYVSDDYLDRNGRLGRSWGCPVLQNDVYKQVINTIKNGSMIFAYYNDKKYLESSKYLKKRS